LERRLIEQFEREGSTRSSIRMRYFLDLRYQGQVHELTVEIPSPEWVTAQGMPALRAAFERQYRAVYGGASVSASYASIELVGVGVDGIVEHAKPSLRQQATGNGQQGAKRAPGAQPSAQPRAYRQACFSLQQGFLRVPVYADGDLVPGQELRGPAFVQNDYLTMIVLPGQVGQTDDLGNLVVDHARGKVTHD
ncbi:MAG: hypothetical protein KGJ86_20760, partial [Chloroflexota bacterium]|nr:hypothetical protein [Chloroflexota bacterium]